MSLNAIDRSRDEEIIDIMASILSEGNVEVETFNESILVKLMELRGTPVKVKKSYRNIQEDYEKWKSEIYNKKY